LAVLLVGQLLGCSPVLLGLGVQVVDGLVAEETSVTYGLRSCQLLRPTSLKTNILAPCEWGQYLGRTL
jgi:hypothetical protein